MICQGVEYTHQGNGVCERKLADAFFVSGLPVPEHSGYLGLSNGNGVILREGSLTSLPFFIPSGSCTAACSSDFPLT